MNDYSGEKFLDKLYRNLYMSDEVQHTKENIDKRYEAIRRYLDRIESVHKKADTETKKSLLKSLYYDKYIIKEDILRKKIKSEHNYPKDMLQEIIDNIIKAQKESLDKWVDYLMDEHTNYPMWAKYWAFQGMLKMGNYDEGIEGYQKRSKDTESPFVDANPEIIAKAISTIEKSISKKDINDEELEKIINSGSFSKIYTILEKRYKDKVIEYSGTEGIWIKYNQGSEEDAIKLSESLQGKNTHWCTADRQTAINQVCGPYDSSKGGDFYVYYTKDKEGNYTLPRIAMRMNNDDEIAEIRGIEDGQNLEEELVPILEEKLKEMNNITEKSRKDAFKTIDGLKELTEIYKKTIQKQELTEQEIEDLYLKEFGFGWYETDPRAIKTIQKRDVVADFNSIKDIKTKVKIYEELERLIIIDRETINSLTIDEAFVREYIKDGRSHILSRINPETMEDYDGLALFAVQNDYYALKYIDPKYATNYDKLCKMAINKSVFMIEYINPEFAKQYAELAKIAVTKSGDTLKYINSKYVDYSELAKIAVTQCPLRTPNSSTIILGSIEISPKDVDDYQELARISVENFPNYMGMINPKDVPDYQALVDLAISLYPEAIIGIDPHYVNNYDSLAIEAVNAFPYLFEYLYQKLLSKETINELKEIYKDVEITRDALEKEYDEYRDDELYAKDRDSIYERKKMGFIDIISITTLIFALGFMLLTILKLK